MKNKNVRTRIGRQLLCVLIISCFFLLGACQSGSQSKIEPTDTPTPTVTVAPEATSTPEATIPVDVTLGQYKKLTLTKVTSETIEDEIDAILTSYASYDAVDRAAIEGDTVNVNYVGTLDGVAFDGGTDDSEAGTDLVLGSNQFIDGFEEGLIGAKTGDVVELNLTFPDPYSINPDMSGKSVVFTVTVNSVKEYNVPELTEEFLTSNSGYKTVEEFRNDVAESLNQSSFFKQISEQLLSNCTVENLSEEEIATETESFVNQYLSQAAYYGSMYGVDTATALQYFFGVESEAVLRQYGEEYAKRMLSYTAILKEIATVENIELTDEIYNDRANAYATQNGYETIEAFVAQYGEELVRETILLDITAEFCIDNSFILEAE